MMVVAAAVLAAGMIELDRVVPGRVDRTLSFAYTGGAEGARSVLSTIAGSMITVAGVVFSITIVALTLASSQFGPRLLRNFIRDRSNQLVLGTFIAAYIYCLLVLRTIRGPDEGDFVPGISVIVAVLLATLDLAVLIYFIHHVAMSIQANTIIANVGEELQSTIDRLFPEEVGAASREPAGPTAASDLPDFEAEGKRLTIASNGYIIAIDASHLMHVASKHDILLKLVRRPGHFVIEGDPVAILWPASKASDEIHDDIRDAFQLGTERTALQDVEFSIDQLVEVAVRALSPGINDPFTAIACIDRLGTALCHIAKRRIPSPYRIDDEQHLRIIAYPVAMADLLAASFNQIRQYGSSSPAILIRLLETLARIASRTKRNEDLAAVRKHVEAVFAAADKVKDDGDFTDIQYRYETALTALDPAAQAQVEVVEPTIRSGTR